MKKVIYILLISIPLGLQAQLYVGPGETVTVLEGTDMFAAGIVVDNSGTPGTLDVQAASLITLFKVDGEITGDDRISLGDRTSWNLSNCTWTASWDSPTENNEVLERLDLLIGAAAIVPPGNSLEVTDQLAVVGATGTVLTLEANASGYGQLLTSGTGPNPILNTSAGDFEAQQYLTTDANIGWRQLSFPVSATLGQLEDDLTMFNSSNGVPDQYSIFYYDAEPIGIGATAPGGTNSLGTDATDNTSTQFSAANAKHWTIAPGTFDGNPLTETNTTPVGPGNNARAYNIFTGGNLPALDATTPGLIDISGTTIGNGSYTFECYTTHDVVFEAGKTPLSVDETQITGWNNIPNPYPSNIDVSLLLADADFISNFDYGAVHVWNPKGGSGPNDLKQYIAITDGIETFVDWNTGLGTGVTTTNIAPFQSFWVKTERAPTTGSISGPDATLTLKNGMRTVTDNANYFKAAPPLMRLNVIDQSKDGYVDQAILAFDPTSTEGIDRNDAYKFPSPVEEVPSMYTKIDGAKFTINRMPNPDPSYSIPLYLESRKAGEKYKMAMVDENLDPSWTIYLEDVKTGKMHNLRNGEYAFAHDANLNTNRFVVHVNKFAGNIDVNSWNNVNIYPSSDGINVAFANPDEATAKITISNLAGQVMYQGEVSTGRLFTFPINDDVALYAVKVITGSKVTHDKVVR